MKIKTKNAIIEVAGKSQKWFDNLSGKEQKAYLKEHPNSKFGKGNSKSKGKGKGKKITDIFKMPKEERSLVRMSRVDTEMLKEFKPTKKLAKDLKAIQTEINKEAKKQDIKNNNITDLSALKSLKPKLKKVISDAEKAYKKHAEELEEDGDYEIVDAIDDVIDYSKDLLKNIK